MNDSLRDPKPPAVWPLVMTILAIAVSAAVLLLTIPHLFGNGTPELWGLAAGLAIAVAGFGILGVRLRSALNLPRRGTTRRD